MFGLKGFIHSHFIHSNFDHIGTILANSLLLFIMDVYWKNNTLLYIILAKYIVFLSRLYNIYVQGRHSDHSWCVYGGGGRCICVIQACFISKHASSINKSELIKSIWIWSTIEFEIKYIYSACEINFFF